MNFTNSTTSDRIIFQSRVILATMCVVPRLIQVDYWTYSSFFCIIILK